jgi:hypothetical protein
MTNGYTLRWEPYTGNAIDFDGTVYTVTLGFEGWLFADSNMSSARMGDQTHVLESVLTKPRYLKLPILVQAATRPLLDDAMAALIASANPYNAQEGRLVITRADGTTKRTIQAILYNGSKGTDAQGKLGDFWSMLDLTWICFDPFFANYDETVEEYSQTGPPTFFPIFPVELGAGLTFTDINLVVGGDLSVWPIWQILGPGQAIKLTNLTTNKLLNLPSLVLTGAQTVIIDTRPGMKTVTVGGVNYFSYLSNQSVLWPLVAGDNHITVDITNPTGATRVQLHYYKRYFTA